MLVDVATFSALPPLLTYRVPEPLIEHAQVGCRVVVPLGRRAVVGLLVGATASTSDAGLPDERIRPLEDVLDPNPVLDGELLEFLRWVARYYFAPLGEVLRLAIPASLQGKTRPFVSISERGRQALASSSALLTYSNESLSREEAALLSRLAATKRGRGATGLSGKMLRRLQKRGLVELGLRNAQPVAPRLDWQLSLSDNCPADAEASLGRAPRQAALIGALRRAGGQARLSQLDLPARGQRSVAERLAARGLLAIDRVEAPRDPLAGVGSDGRFAEPVASLTEAQQVALAALCAAADEAQFVGYLLHGVTGSGKTEVYLRFLSHVLAAGKTALVLVPEIALTPQLAGHFRRRFGSAVAVLHSGLTPGERHDQWHLIQRGQVQIVVGARSAIFAPLRGIGALIVDEEHDASFKQEDGVRYNARDLALARGKQQSAVVVLGSATPSVETRYAVDQGRLRLLAMPKRATPRPLPRVEIVDLRIFSAGQERSLSAPLAKAMAETLTRKEQVILFLNRRGFCPFVMCGGCGHVFRCVNCSVSLTHHRSAAQLVCHYCGFTTPQPTQCPACSADDAIMLRGLGTERLEQAIVERFPQANVARLDRDTASAKGMQRILASVACREVDVLIGTQMVTKGHDFPGVTLVGVICADLGLNFPDFRAAERTFQLLTQVAGRAGRGQRAGRVIIQTYNPDHPSIVAASAQDFTLFCNTELAARRELGYPPFAHLAAIRIDASNPELARRSAERLAQLARAASGTKVVVMGPVQPPLQRIKGHERWMLLLKSPARAALRAVIESLHARLVEFPRSSALRLAIDIDPRSLL